MSGSSLKRWARPVWVGISLLAGCAQPSTPVGTELVIKRVIQLPDVRVRRCVAFRSQSEYEAFFSDAGNLAPTAEVGGALPQVDFHSEMVVAYFGGERPTAGYGVTIDQVVETDADLFAMATFTVPAAGDIVAQVITYPGQAVVVDATDKPLRCQLVAQVR